MKKNIFIIAMAAVMASACSSSKQVVSSADLNGEWTIEKVNGTAINKNAGDEIPFLGFEVDKKNVYGCTGCNRDHGNKGQQARSLKDGMHTDVVRRHDKRADCSWCVGESKLFQHRRKWQPHP